jgi:C4-dicarboxylate transporter DctM subunit
VGLPDGGEYHSLIVGCFLDPTSAILVLTPLLMPLVKSVGVDPIHFGIVMTANLAIGMFTPPFGLNIFVARTVLGVPLGDDLSRCAALRRGADCLRC